MYKLVEDLKEEHQEIVQALEGVRVLGIGSKEGQEKLLSAKAFVLSHLEKEDKQLYPVLRKAAQDNSKLRQTLELFARDMEDVSRKVLYFFDKYSKGGSGLEFAKDFGRLVGVLRIRIRREEQILYAEFAKLNT